MKKINEVEFFKRVDQLEADNYHLFEGVDYSGNPLDGTTNQDILRNHIEVWESQGEVLDIKIDFDRSRLPKELLERVGLIWNDMGK